uniref:Uncharacterized protein n=1 Tax=Rhizophora mucronata TaxID=61149 RepID=A0A2P2PKC8_RHIMU
MHWDAFMMYLGSYLYDDASS